jgi:hypothetical protein
MGNEEGDVMRRTCAALKRLVYAVATVAMVVSGGSGVATAEK